jgi:hypothetical protein
MPWNIINSVKTVANTKKTDFVGWIATGYGSANTRLARSNNGTTWTGLTFPWTSEYYYNDIAYGKDDAGNNLWVAVGNVTGARIATSLDGINWTQGAPAAFGVGNGIAYGKDGSGVGLWVCACNGGIAPGNSIATSYDGTNWTGKGRNGFLYGAKAVAYGKDNLGNGVWIAVSDQGENDAVIRSSNGTNWSSISSSGILSSIKNIRYGKNGAGNGLWVAGGTGTPNIFASSTDGGNTWSGNGGKTNFISVNEVSYGKDGSGNGLWVAACSSYSSSPTKFVAISSNGTTWSPVTINSSIITTCNGVKYGKDGSGNDLWVAIGSGQNNTNTFAISRNGDDWQGAGGQTAFPTQGNAIAFSEIING